MKQPLVTVLMPNHNGAKTIAESIQSVLDQTMKDFELLIVEDASTDQSRQVIASFTDPRIRMMPFEQNEHICIALNTGIRSAKGKYIARIDSDDCWLPQKLEKQIAYMEAHPKCGASFSWVNVINEEGESLSASQSMFVELFAAHNRPRAQWIHDFFHNGSALCHPSAVFPRSVALELGGYRNSLVQVQDYDLWIRIAKKYDIYVFEEPLMNYRHALHGGNVSEQNVPNTIRSHYETYNVIRHYFDGMTDEAFIDCFGQDFKIHGTTDHVGILCEQALLLLEPLFWGHIGKLAGMDMLGELLDNEETRLALRQRYGVTQMNYYQLTASRALQMEDDSFIINQFSRRQLLRIVFKKTLHKHPLCLKIWNRFHKH